MSPPTATASGVVTSASSCRAGLRMAEKYTPRPCDRGNAACKAGSIEEGVHMNISKFRSKVASAHKSARQQHQGAAERRGERHRRIRAPAEIRVEHAGER